MPNQTNTENKKNAKKVVTRFPPSPTGFKHIGNYRTALFCYLFARQNKGSFILRIEDTDRARSKKEYEQHIYDTLKWLNLEYDEVYVQSKNGESHKKYLHKMIESGHAYLSKEDSKENPGTTVELVRFKNPNKKVSFDDLIRGKVEIDTTDLGDFIIAKNIDEPLFHLAVVVDDFEEGVTHVLRGEDHISNTPRHILIQEAIGAPVPMYAHLSLLMSPDKSKMASRKGAVSPSYYKERGYLPEAMINYMALLGWNPGDDREILGMKDLLELFDLTKVQKGAAIFDEVKLSWVNKEHLKKLSDEEFRSGAITFVSPELKASANFSDTFKKILPLLRERISYFGEIKDMETAGDLQMFFAEPSYAAELLLCPEKQRKGKDISLAGLAPIFSHLHKTLETANETSGFTSESVKELVWPYAETEGRGIVLWAFRVALSGKERSPDPFNMAAILGKAETLKRLSSSLKKINTNE